jgi:hypothetical protein
MKIFIVCVDFNLLGDNINTIKYCGNSLASNEAGLQISDKSRCVNITK